jgi:uncharacterized repeat protein (TIGR03803 family)
MNENLVINKPLNYMKSSNSVRRLRPLWLMLTVYATAFPIINLQASVAFTELHSFGVFTNGANPQAALVLGSDGSFYGTAYGGGTNGGYGAIFKISANGSLTSIYSFAGGANGEYPESGLIQGSDGNLYGTTYGGTIGNGTVFKVTTNGTLSTLYSFTGNKDGSWPVAALVQGSDGNFYGTAVLGGTFASGSVFKVTPNGTFTTLYSFSAGSSGASPYASLIQGSDGDFYGTTSTGGTGGCGTIFKVTASGALTNLYSFNGGNDGYNSYAALVEGGDGNFYGTTSAGGANGFGTVFKISPNGNVTDLYAFTNRGDGGSPKAALIQGSDGNFYGTTSSGGPNGAGTVFRITTNGALTSLYPFTGGTDGGIPLAALVQGSGDNFYGTASSGGPNGVGTVFRITTNGVFATLSPFTGGNDGGNPRAALVQSSDGNFYGTTYGYVLYYIQGPYPGDTNGAYGTVFRMTTNGSLTTLCSFNVNDGANPAAGLIQGGDGNFYGTTAGGTNDVGGGTVFRISANGALTTLGLFDQGYGANPHAALIQASDGNFYGTTSSGGPIGAGDVFKINANDVLTNLYSFKDGNDGSSPPAALVLGRDGNFYGTTSFGGTNGWGTVFRISPSGALTSLYSFTDHSDGSVPNAALVLGSDGNFYGTTYGASMYGGSGNGSVFKITTNGNFTSLYSFTSVENGLNPDAALIQGSDGNFYGTTSDGGTNGDGTVFEITTNGALTSLYSFTGVDGAAPGASLVQGTDGDFYGTTSFGGLGGNGVAFRISLGLAPLPTIQFTANLTNGVAPLAVQFSCPGVDSSGSKIVSWSWTFDDGGTSSLQNPPPHIYTTAGVYAPTLVVTNSGGVAIFATGPEITVEPANQGQYVFCTEVQTTNSSSINYDSGLFTYTDSDASDTHEEHAILPLCGGAASAINSTNAWTASISVNLSARSMPTAGGPPDYTSHAELGFVVSTNLSGPLSSADFVFELAQENNTGDGDGGSTDIYPDGWYGTALSFQAFLNSSRDPATPLGASQATGNGSIYLLLSGSTASSGSIESIDSASGTLSITYSPSNKTVVGSYNGTNVASYSIAGWGSNPPLELGVWGSSGKLLAISSGTATASDFYVSAIASSGSAPLSLVTNSGAFGFTNGVFGFSISGPAGSNVVIQVSADLKTWIPLQTNVLVNGTVYYSDSQSPTNRQRFYRAELSQ